MAVALPPFASSHHLLLLPFFLSLLLFIAPSTPTPVFVVTPAGVLEGTEDLSPDGHPYFGFRGIPYAHPPVGERRWKVPEALPRFQSVYRATAFGPACPQREREGGVVVGTAEDCLLLDVYAPRNVSGAVWTNGTQAWQAWTERQRNQTVPDPGPGPGLPVMVWIHGGSYRSGSSAKNEAWKMATEQGLVVVVIQYRLGALGFLSSGSSDLPGNYGLWDQRLALKWVKDNIRGFGGDAAMVTACGESAGSSSVSQHTLSARSAGLFQRAVLMSGVAEASWSFNPNPGVTFDQFSQNAGCGDNVKSVATRLQCLMTLPVDVIYQAAVSTEVGGSLLFVPTADGDFFPDAVPRLLQDEDYLTSAGFYDYDFLVGTLNNEGVVAFDLLAAFAPSLPSTGRYPYSVIDGGLLEFFLTGVLGPGHGPNVLDVVNSEYFYPRGPEERSMPVRRVFDLATDAMFIVPAMKMLRLHAGTRSSGASSGGASGRSSGRSYLFFFDWVPSLTEGTMFEGMPHALDVDYMWGLTNDSLLLYDELPLGGSILPREHEVSRLFGDMIGGFVRTGDPNNGIEADLRGQWAPYDPSNETFLRFALNSSVDRHLHGDKVSLWVDLLPRLQSHWLNRPDGRPPANQSAECPELTYFDLSESEANAMMISLLVVCGVLLLFCLFLFVKLMTVYRRKNSNRYGLGTEESRRDGSGKIP